MMGIPFLPFLGSFHLCQHHLHNCGYITEDWWLVFQVITSFKKKQKYNREGAQGPSSNDENYTQCEYSSFQEVLSSVYRHTIFIFKVLVWKKESSHGKEKLFDKRGENVFSHTKAVSFVLIPINGILQPILKLLKVTLNSMEKTCQLMFF